ncbi:MAG TPA: hypothetical protein P5328_02145 [Candidatus Paceibacterota bacterium]|nr:hypothetical protein [Candidatus Paceibacterota bacterium]HRZ34447.1 hypothetical protein [Candidatus Paceibacterota bacterium]
MDEQNSNVPVENSSGSKKKIYGIIAVVIIALIAFFVFGSKKTIAPGVEINQKLNGDVTYTSEDGTVTVGTNSLPANWPSDVPSYPGAAVLAGSVTEQDGQNRLTASFITNDNALTVSNFYKTELEKAGWTISQMTSMGNAAVLSADKDGRNVGLYIGTSEEGETSIVIGISTLE